MSENEQNVKCSRSEAARKGGLARRKRPFESLYNSLVYTSKSRHIELSLTYEDLLSFVGTPDCHYCGGVIGWHPYYSSRAGVSTNLDRKDSGQGYSKENCVVCCSRCNLGKGDRFTYEEWLEIGKVIRAMNLVKAASQAIHSGRP
jgi:hypothetical protein